MARTSGRATLLPDQVREDGAPGTVRRAWRSGRGRLEAPRFPPMRETAGALGRAAGALTGPHDDPMRGGHRGLLR